MSYKHIAQQQINRLRKDSSLKFESCSLTQFFSSFFKVSKAWSCSDSQRKVLSSPVSSLLIGLMISEYLLRNFVQKKKAKKKKKKKKNKHKKKQTDKKKNKRREQN